MTTRFPAPNRFANPSAAYTFAPALDPPSTPSCAANSFTMPNACSSVTMITSSQTERSKFPGIKLFPMPSTLCGPGCPAAQYRAFRLHRDRAHRRSNMLFQKARHPRKRSRRPTADRDRVHTPFHLLENFAGGSFIVVVGIGGIVELGGQKCGGIDLRTALWRGGLLPAMPSASGVRVTSAPRARMMITFSSENLSGTNSRTL